MEEMRIAFKALEKGREKELEEISLVYFAKKKALFDRYMQVKQKFKHHKEHVAQEFKVKDVIEQQLRDKIKELEQEVEVAKLVLRDVNLSRVANNRFAEVIEQDNKEKFLQGGTFFDDLMEKQRFQAECYVYIKEKEQKAAPFNKSRVKITTRTTDNQSKTKPFFTSRHSVWNEKSVASTRSQKNDWVSNSVLQRAVEDANTQLDKELSQQL